MPPPDITPLATTDTSLRGTPKRYGRQFENGFARIRSRFAQVQDVVAQQADVPPPSGVLIRIAGNDRGNRFDRHVQLFGDNLPVSRVDRTLPEVALAGADEHRAVGVGSRSSLPRRGGALSELHVEVIA